MSRVFMSFVLRRRGYRIFKESMSNVLPVTYLKTFPGWNYSFRQDMRRQRPEETDLTEITDLWHQCMLQKNCFFAQLLGISHKFHKVPQSSLISGYFIFLVCLRVIHKRLLLRFSIHVTGKAIYFLGKFTFFFSWHLTNHTELAAGNWMEVKNLHLTLINLNKNLR